MEKPISSRIEVLVHPFHAELGYRSLDQYTVRAVSTMLGIWAKKIRDVSRDPNTFFIIVTPVKMQGRKVLPSAIGKKYLTNEEFLLRNKVVSKFERLVEFAHKKMGKRLLTVEFNLNRRNIKAEIQNKGFELAPKIRGKTFGEYFDICVSREAREIMKQIKGSRMRRDAAHSTGANGNMPIRASLTIHRGFTGMRFKGKLSHQRVSRFR